MGEMRLMHVRRDRYLSDSPYSIEMNMNDRYFITPPSNHLRYALCEVNVIGPVLFPQVWDNYASFEDNICDDTIRCP